MASAGETIAPRRSSRISAKKGSAVKEPTNLDGDDDFEDVGDASDHEDSRPTKRRKPTTASRKSAVAKKETGKRRGLGAKRSLSKLPDMPLDILFEIFGHLHPLDLLHLARSDKALRGVLMRRSSRSLWIQVLKNIQDLPDCPPDMSEPEFVNLVFDPRCHFCLSARVLTVMWRSRVRCCKNCVNDNFMDLGAYMALLYPMLTDQRRIKTFDLIPRDEYKSKPFLRKTEVFSVRDRLQEIGSDEDKFREFVEEKREAARAIENHAALMEEWYYRQSDKRAQELEDLRIKRQQAIMSKLRDLGFGTELDDLDEDTEDEFLNHPTVKQPKELTDRIWNNIKGPIIELMQRARALRIAQERAFPLFPRVIFIGKVCAQFVLARPNNEFLPRIADFSLMPEIKSILQMSDVPAQTVFDELRQKLAEFSERWRQDCSRKILALLPASAKQHQIDENDLTPLNLATTVFCCNYCDSIVRHPKLLAHDCMSRGTENGQLDLSHTPDADVLNVMQMVFQEQPWRIMNGDLVYHESSANFVADIVRLCGKDPEVTTAQDMDEHDARFVCRHTHCKNYPFAYATTWRTAVLHMKSFHTLHTVNASWTVLNAADIALVKSIEAREKQFQKIWSCEHCRDDPRELAHVKNHIRAKHDIIDPVEGTDYFKHPSAEPGPSRPTVLKPYQLTTLHAEEPWLSRDHPLFFDPDWDSEDYSDYSDFSDDLLFFPMF